MTNVVGTLFFIARDASGDELWKSDGTEAGTVLVKDIRSGAYSSIQITPFLPTNVDGMLFFAANDGSNGTELWKSDGTEAGTVLVGDIAPGSASSLPRELTNVNGRLFFSADSGLYGRELWTLSPSPTIVGRSIFYNNSAFDGNNAGINDADDSAIAPDKTAYLAGAGVATPANVTSFARGINGVMVDANLAGPVTLDDFSFKVGNNNSPATWADAPVPVDFSVRPGAGIDGSDRIEIVWADGTIKNQWLEVTVEGNDAAGGFNTNTGLAASDVFYFGNLVGETFENPPPTVFYVGAADEISIRAHLGAAAITSPWDIDRDGVSGSAADQLASRTNRLAMLRRIDLAGAALAPPVASAVARDPALSAVAVALAKSDRPPEPERPPPALSPARSESQTLIAKPPPLAFLSARLAEDRSVRSRALLATMEEFAASPLVDDELIGGVMAQIGGATKQSGPNAIARDRPSP